MMKKKIWIVILILVFLLIIIRRINISSNKQDVGIKVSYSEKEDQIIVHAVRPSKKHEPYEYENRLATKEIMSLSDRYEKDGTDVFVFNIISNGVTELAFFSIDNQDINNKYKNAYELSVVVTDNTVDLGNMFLNRKKMYESLINIRIDSFTDKLINEYSSVHEYINDEDGDKFIIWTNTLIKDFNFITVDYADKENKYSFREVEKLFTADELSPEIPFVVKLKIPVGIPAYGISFIDENGNVRYYTINVSGAFVGEAAYLREFKNTNTNNE
jgi:hypothetical protein